MLSEVEFSINKNSRIGLIGDNGSGKTTLLKCLLAVDLKTRSAFSGSTVHQVLMLSQEPFIGCENKSLSDYIWNLFPEEFECSEVLESLQDGKVWSDDLADILSEERLVSLVELKHKIEKYSQLLELSNFDQSRRLKSLSGGERQRVALLTLLIQEPDLLLLDEPSNHLDDEYQAWVVEFIRRLEIPFILVSHDRSLLDSVVTEIWSLKEGRLERHTGNYSSFKAFKEEELARQMKEYEHRRERIERLEQQFRGIRDYAKSLNQFTEGLKVTSKGKVIKDASRALDGKEIGTGMMRRAVAMESRIERELEKEKENLPVIEKLRIVKVDSEQSSRKRIVQLTDVGLKRGERRLFSNINLDLRAGDNLLLVGPNGTGKSSLLEVILGQLPATEGLRSMPQGLRCSYLSQNSKPPKGFESVTDYLSTLTKDKQSGLRAQLGGLRFPLTGLNRPFESLSPGELQKFCLAKALMEESDLLVLDEPTNHLEIKSREALERALLLTTKSLIVTTHDEFLKKALAEKERTQTMILGKIPSTF